MTKYSIILPVRNGGEYVKQCVQSILNQTFNDFNCIILDNDSNDGTAEWIKSLRDERIIIHPSGKSLSIGENWARITAIDKNEFMTVIGHDDILHLDYLAVMNALVENHPDASLYLSHFKFIDAKGNEVRSCLPMKEIQYAHEFLNGEMTQTMDSTGTGYMMRSKDYDAVGGISPLYPNLIFADYELWMKLTGRSYLAVTGREAFSYRLHESVSKLTNGDDYQQAFCRYIEFLAGLRNNNKALASTIDQHGKRMLLYFCQSLSHRLLKTPKKMRKTTVGEFINKCRRLAKDFIPGQSFKPMAKPGILAAYLLDNAAGIKLFGLYKKLQTRSSK